MSLRNLLLVVFALFANLSIAQESDFPLPEKRSPISKNGLTFNFPGILHIDRYTGWSIGGEYRRLLNKRGTLGTSLTFTRLIWAGTAEAGKYYAKGYRANIKANLIAPGINYYPLGSGGFASIELGALAVFGTIFRVNSYQSNGGYNSSTTESAPFFSPQFHAGVSILGRRSLLLTFYTDYGPIVKADSKTEANYGVIGLKIGGRF